MNEDNMGIPLLFQAHRQILSSYDNVLADRQIVACCRLFTSGLHQANHNKWINARYWLYL